MRQIEYQGHEVIFLEGDEARTMFVIESGEVGIFSDYGTPDERALATLSEGAAFGEMGLVELYPRSATAVVLSDTCVVDEIEAEEFAESLKDRPEVVLSVMRQVSARLRETNQLYVEACEAVYEAVEAERRREKRSLSLIGRLKRMLVGSDA